MLSHSNPLGYRNLLTWKQANDLFLLTEEFVKSLPYSERDPADHMIRSARSVVRNIEEGYARTTTKEYISFLGFSAGSLEELIADYKHCQKGNKGDPIRVAKGIQMGVGEAKMLDKQIKSLEEKGYREKTVSANDMARRELKRQADKNKEFDEYLKRVREGKE